MNTINFILSLKLTRLFIILASIAFIALYSYDHVWIDHALLMTRIVLVFLILSLFPRIPAWSLLPAAIFIGPIFDRILDFSEEFLMGVTRLIVEHAVNPQFVLIIVVLALFIVILFSLLYTKKLRYLFLFVFLLANIGASLVFHYTQVDRFIHLESQRLQHQANLLIANMNKSGFEKLDYICGLHGLTCAHGTDVTPTDEIDEEFHDMFLQAVGESPASYRSMRKFDDSSDDPAKANMFQIYMYQQDGKWIYMEDQNLIAPYYFNARRNFSILYSSFSVVWILILYFVLYRHSSFLDRRFTFFQKKGIITH